MDFQAGRPFRPVDTERFDCVYSLHDGRVKGAERVFRVFCGSTTGEVLSDEGIEAVCLFFRALKISVGNSLDLRVVRDVYRRRDHGVVHPVIEWSVVHLDCGYSPRLILGDENVVWRRPDRALALLTFLPCSVRGAVSVSLYPGVREPCVVQC